MKMYQGREIAYWGLFVSDGVYECNKARHKFKRISDCHITFGYNPAETDEIPFDLLGKEFEIAVTGYGMDEKAAGLRVEIPDELKKYYRGAKNVHITTSISEIGRPVDTGNIKEWKDCCKWYLKGKLGLRLKK